MQIAQVIEMPRRQRRYRVNSDIEDLLRKFVADGTEDRIERKTDREIIRKTGNKVDHLVKAQADLVTWTKLHEQKDEQRHDEVKEAIRGLGSRVTKLESEAESTGKHNIEDLQRRLKERDENSRWWRRHMVAVITGIVATLATALIVGSCTYLFTHRAPTEITVEPVHPH